MINTAKLREVLETYKRDSSRFLWKNEQYKWIAVKHFQDHWDIQAVDFLTMFEKATAKAQNLLASMNFYPRGMIRDFARADPEQTRAMFMALFDETKGLAERVNNFEAESEAMRSKYGAEKWKSHFQTTNSISTYLWLRFPDKYYIYKYSEYRAVAKRLESDFSPVMGQSSANLLGGFRMYDEIGEELRQDEELRRLLSEALTPDCYPDPELRTLTIDVGFYISRYGKPVKAAQSDWFPLDYDPGLTADQWIELIQNPDVFTPDSLKIMKRLKDIGGAATCTDLANKYGASHNFYNAGSTALAQRVANRAGVSPMARDTGKSSWWPVLYLGKYAGKAADGVFIWKLRDELSQALDRVDLSQVPLHEPEQVTEQPKEAATPVKNYWWLNANPSKWSFSSLAVGQSRFYTFHNENNHKRRIFQNFVDARPGDLIIVYESNPIKAVVGLAKVVESPRKDELWFQKIEGLAVPIDYKMLQSMPELEGMEFFANPQGSFFKLTEAEHDLIMDTVRDHNPLPADSAVEAYSKEDFLAEVFMSEEQFDSLASLLQNKKNIILQGAPGVGKTFAARRLAHALMGKKDDACIEFIQFHQNYSYEDFVMGYRPKEEGFELHSGVFHRFCQKAANSPDKDFYFIIDEINRGNLSKIFGELLMLIERDYRGEQAVLAYTGLPFSVPRNLYIIGMMNTADRSLALIDYALRRRFSFFQMNPGFSSEGFRRYQASIGHDTFDVLIAQIERLNQDIAADQSLGRGFQIGHSYFCTKDECTPEWMQQVIEYDVLPLLSEYWFDQDTTLQRWENILRGVLND